MPERQPVQPRKKQRKEEVNLPVTSTNTVTEHSSTVSTTASFSEPHELEQSTNGPSPISESICSSSHFQRELYGTTSVFSSEECEERTSDSKHEIDMYDLAKDIMKNCETLYVSCCNNSFSVAIIENVSVPVRVKVNCNGDTEVTDISDQSPLRNSHPLCVELQAATPQLLNEKLVEPFVHIIGNYSGCLGIPAEKYQTLLLDKFSGKGRILGDKIVSAQCDKLIRKDGDIALQCSSCQCLQNTFDRALAKDYMQPLPHTNYKFLTHHQLSEKLKAETAKTKSLNVKVNRLEAKVSQLIEEHGHDLHQSDSDSLAEVLRKNFKDIKSETLKVFIQQQLLAASCKDSRSMRWHPLLLKLCMFWESKSPAAYESVRQTGFINLPCKKTLRNYSSRVIPQGINKEAVLNLRRVLEEANPTNEQHKKYVALLHDEMRIRDDVVYDIRSGELVGFVNLPESESDFLATIEDLVSVEKLASANKNGVPVPELATHILQFMVRGLTSGVTYPLAYFPTSSMKASELYEIFWEIVKQLELQDIRVLVSVSDGAGVNRAFLKMCCGDDVNSYYKSVNPFAGDEIRFIYFISDAPHLIKTARNCVSNSNFHQKTRLLWNNGDIFWTHFLDTFNKDLNMTPRYAPKITVNHLYLNAFSKMKVNFAAQVLSATNANAMELLCGEETKASVTLARMINKFLDIMNGRNVTEGLEKRNPDLNAFHTKNDPRLNVCNRKYSKLCNINTFPSDISFRARSFCVKLRI